VKQRVVRVTMLACTSVWHQVWKLLLAMYCLIITACYTFNWNGIL